MGKQNKRGQSVLQFSPKLPKCFRNLWMLIVSFKQTIIQLKSLSLLVQQLNLTLGEKEPLKSVAGELKGLKRAEDVNQLKVQPIYYSLNETNTTNNVLFQSEFPVSSCKL